MAEWKLASAVAAEQLSSWSRFVALKEPNCVADGPRVVWLASPDCSLSGSGFVVGIGVALVEP